MKFPHARSISAYILSQDYRNQVSKSPVPTPSDPAAEPGQVTKFIEEYSQFIQVIPDDERRDDVIVYTAYSQSFPTENLCGTHIFNIN